MSSLRIVGENETSGSGTEDLPVKTFAEIVRRYGSSTPILVYGQSLTIHQLSSQPAGQDPVWFVPFVSGGGNFAFIGTLIPFGSTFLAGAVTPKVRSSTGNPLKIANMPPGILSGMLIYNETRNSYAFVGLLSGISVNIQATGPSWGVFVSVPTGVAAGYTGSYSFSALIQINELV